MFNKFQIFSKEALGSVRTLISETGDIWFFGIDVCNILGLSNSRKAYQRLEKEELLSIKSELLSVTSSYGQMSSGTAQKSSTGGAQEYKLISESGLYDLVMGSRKPEARPFQRWVTQEVLPSIRKNGGYILGQEELSISDREKVEAQIQALSAQVKALQSEKKELEYTSDMFCKYYEDILELYKNLKKELHPADSTIGTPAPDAPRFYDNYGNVYYSREEAITAIREE